MPAVRTDRIRERRQKLEAELKVLREAEREAEEQRHAIAGRVVLEHAEHDERFRTDLTAILDRALTKKRERKLFDLPVSARTRRSDAAETTPRGVTEPGDIVRTGTEE